MENLTHSCKFFWWKHWQINHGYRCFTPLPSKLTENASYYQQVLLIPNKSNGKIIPRNWRYSETIFFFNNLPPVCGLRYRQDVLHMRNSIKDNVGSPIGNLDLVTIRNVRLMISCFYFDSLRIGILTSSSAIIKPKFISRCFSQGDKNFSIHCFIILEIYFTSSSFWVFGEPGVFCLFDAAVFCETLGFFFKGFCEPSDAAGLLSWSSARNGVSGGETE